MSRPSLQLLLDFNEVRAKVPASAEDAAAYTPWPKEAREAEVGRAVAEALSAMLYLSADRDVAEQFPRLVETAILASSAGPGGAILLEQVDRALVQLCGRDHGLLEGKYL